MNASKREVRNFALAGGQHTFRELAAHLTSLGLRNTYGMEYQGGRGTAKLVSSTHHDLVRAGDPQEADVVARAYTRNNRSGYAYQ